MRVDVVTRIIINRPREAVANFAADPSNAPRWYVNIKSIEWKTPPPVAVGSQVAFVAHFLGRRMAYTYEVLEFVPSQRMVMATAEGPFPMETSYAWQTVGEGQTEMTLRNRGNPSGLAKVLSLFMVHAMRRANRNDLARLKALMEQTV